MPRRPEGVPAVGEDGPVLPRAAIGRIAYPAPAFRREMASTQCGGLHGGVAKGRDGGRPLRGGAFGLFISPERGTRLDVVVYLGSGHAGLG